MHQSAQAVEVLVVEEQLEPAPTLAVDPFLPDPEERIGDRPDVMTEIADLARQLDAAQKKVSECQMVLARATAAETHIRESLLPELIETLGGQKHFEIDDFMVDLEDSYYAHISRERAPDAHTWLDEHQEGGMIKRKVIVEFARDQEAMVKELITSLTKTYPQTREEKKVEASTLKAWVKKRAIAGKATPEDLFGIHVQPVARLKRKKKK